MISKSINEKNSSVQNKKENGKVTQNDDSNK